MATGEEQPPQPSRAEADPAALKEEIIRLGPWHLDVQVTPEISTRAFLEAPRGGDAQDPGTVSFIRAAREHWHAFLNRIYPRGLEGRSFLDCACNCGGYSFWSKELGAGECFGFDVREHWIDQAQFLLEHRPWPSDGIHFEVLDLYDLSHREPQPFDVVLFKGIFYHLPDPVTGLKVAADLAKELIIVDTRIRTDLPDGLLAVDEESAEAVMSGVHGLNWYPTGPKVLQEVLKWLGFQDTQVVYWNREPSRLSHFGRLRIVGSRQPGLLTFPSVTKISPRDRSRRRFRPRDLGAARRFVRRTMQARAAGRPFRR